MNIEFLHFNIKMKYSNIIETFLVQPIVSIFDYINIFTEKDTLPLNIFYFRQSIHNKGQVNLTSLVCYMANANIVVESNSIHRFKNPYYSLCYIKMIYVNNILAI